MNRSIHTSFQTFAQTGWTGILLLLLFTAGSCKKNFLPDQSGDDKIVILAEITAGDMARVPISKTIHAGGGNLVNFEKLNDATVTLQEGNHSKWLMKVDKSAQYADNPACVFYYRHNFKYNTFYTLEVQHPVLGNAKAVTIIPPPLPHITIDTVHSLHQGKQVLKVTLEWKDSAGRADLYIVEAVKQLIKMRRYFYFGGTRYDYDTKDGAKLFEQVKDRPGVRLLLDTLLQQKFLRLNLYSSDKNLDNFRFENPESAMRRMFLTDQAFNGETYKLVFSIDKDLFTASTPDQKGRILLQMKSASKDLYKYLVTYEKYKTEFGSIPANQLTSPAGNVLNGLGVFGGDTQREIVWYYDELK